MQGVGVELAAAFGDVEMMIHPLEQIDPVIFFQFLNGPGNGGLGHVQKARGPGDVLGLVHLDKDFHVFYGHGKNSIYVDSNITLMRL